MSLGPALSGQRQAAWIGGLSLAQVKALKNRLGCSFNDVLMACMAGALRTYIARKHATQTTTTAQPQDLHVSIPISMRSQAQVGVLNNEFSLVTARLPVGEADRSQRLKLTQSRFQALRHSIEPIANFLVFKSFGFAPGM